MRRQPASVIRSRRRKNLRGLRHRFWGRREESARAWPRWTAVACSRRAREPALERPAPRALSNVCRHGAVVAIPKFDRLSRDTEGAVHRRRCNPHSHLYPAFANVMSERTKATLSSYPRRITRLRIWGSGVRNLSGAPYKKGFLQLSSKWPMLCQRSVSKSAGP